MAASVNLIVNDNTLNATTMLELRDTSAENKEKLVKLASWLKEFATWGNGAFTVRVSSTAAVRAVGTITLTGNPSADETISIGATVFTFKASASTESEITIGANAAATVTNIVTKINAHSVASKLFLAADGAGDTVVVTHLSGGLGGNGVRFAEAASNLTMDGSGLLGGTTAGAGLNDSTVCRGIGPSGGTLF